MIVAVVLAMSAAMLYGVSDYIGAAAAIRLRVLPTTAVTYVLATAVVAGVLPICGGAWSPAAILWGAAAGVCAVVGFLAFYAAMAAGPMSLMSPLMAALQSTVPVAIAVVIGAGLSGWAWAGVGLGVSAGVLISIDPGHHGPPMSARSLVLALIAGISLGLSLGALDMAPRSSGLVPGLSELLVGVVLVGVVAALSRAYPRVRSVAAWLDADVARDNHQSRRAALILAGVGGLLLGGANALLIIALHIGTLATVSVLVCLYPLATILLALTRRNERLGTAQSVGVALAVVASAVLAVS